MDRFVRSIFSVAFAVVKVPLFIILLVAMVISVVRHPPGRLAHAHMRRNKLRSPAYR
jgi:hypothetical protein